MLLTDEAHGDLPADAVCNDNAVQLLGEPDALRMMTQSAVTEVR